MRILVLNQYFHPDLASTGQLLTELAEDLAEHHRVTVVAGRPSYDPAERPRARGLVTVARHGRVRVLRTWSTAFPRAGMAGRLTNYTTYLASCLAGAVKAERPDVVLAMTDPPVVAAAALLASRGYRVPFVYVNQDVFPEVGVVLGKIRPGPLERSLRRLNRALWTRAARVVVIGRDMRQRLMDRGVPERKLELIPNWADGSAIRPLDGPSPLRSVWGWGDRFVVMASGNVGLSQGLETLVDAAAVLADRNDVLIAIVGQGASRQALQHRARGLGNVVFLPYQPKASLSESLGAADVHYVGLRRGLKGFIVPSKVYGIMAAARPYVAAAEEGSEAALLAEEHGCGVRVEPGDPRALADTILRMRDLPLSEMGRRGRLALEQRFQRPIATTKYRRVLEEVAGP